MAADLFQNVKPAPRRSPEEVSHSHQNAGRRSPRRRFLRSERPCLAAACPARAPPITATRRPPSRNCRNSASVILGTEPFTTITSYGPSSGAPAARLSSRSRHCRCRARPGWLAPRRQARAPPRTPGHGFGQPRKNGGRVAGGAADIEDVILSPRPGQVE